MSNAVDLQVCVCPGPCGPWYCHSRMMLSLRLGRESYFKDVGAWIVERNRVASHETSLRQIYMLDFFATPLLLLLLCGSTAGLLVKAIATVLAEAVIQKVLLLS